MSFSFGSTPLPTSTPATTAAVTPTPSFPFGSGSGDNKQTAGLFGQPLGQTATSQTATGLNFGLGQGKPVAAAAPTSSSSGFGFGASALPQTVGSGGLTFGLGTPASSTASTSTSAAPSFGLSLGATPVSSAPAATSASTSLSFTPILSSTAASSTAGSTAGLTMGFPGVSTNTTQPKLQLGSVPSSAAASSAPSLVLPTPSLAPTQTTTTTSTIPTAGSLTFNQLEDTINKWTIDLEEQGKFFVNQAKQLNAWDSLLISNGEKILNLNGSIERVKQQQSQLDHELDFVLAQQKELEELLVPLEKELVEIPVTDIDRNQMYQFAEIIDSQLKQISDDLKEIIENINESNKDEEVTNPITQIGKILNAHMNSLQWIDRNTAQISGQLEQISKIEDANRRNLNLNNSLNNSINMF